MTERDLEMSVPDWVIEHPETLRVFQGLGIDCSCGGKSLEYACGVQDLDPRVVLAELHRSIHSMHPTEQHMNHAGLIDEYLAGPGKLRDAVSGMNPQQLDAAPIPGKWSTRQIICHIADFEPVYADRMKRSLAEEEPTVFGGDPDAFAARLAYDRRDIEEELQMIDSLRRHMGRILQTLPAEAFQRRVIHSETGSLTLEQLLANVTNHIPHHIRFIKEKRAAMA